MVATLVFLALLPLIIHLSFLVIIKVYELPAWCYAMAVVLSVAAWVSVQMILLRLPMK